MSVAYSPDGLTTIASGSSDRTVKLWNIRDRKNIMLTNTLEGHTDWVTSVAYSPRGDTLATGSEDYTVKIWDMTTRGCIATLQKHGSWVTTISYSLNEDVLATGSNDSTILFWDTRSWANIGTLTGNDRIKVLKYLPNTNLLISLDERGKVKLLHTQRMRAELKGHTATVTAAVLSPDGKRLATGSDDHTVKIWDIENGRCVTTLQGEVPNWMWVSILAYSPDGYKLAMWKDELRVKLWDIKTGKSIPIHCSPIDEVNSIMFAPDGCTLAVGSAGGCYIYTITGTKIKELELDHRTHQVVYSPNGRTLITLTTERGWQDKITFWDTTTWENIRIFSTEENCRVRFLSNNVLIAQDMQTYRVTLYDIANKDNIRIKVTFENRDVMGWIIQAGYFHNTERLATLSEDKDIKIWDTTTGECVKVTRWGGAHNFPSFIIFSDDNKLIVYEGKSIQIWDMSRVRVGRKPSLIWGINYPLLLEKASLTAVHGLSGINRRMMLQRGAFNCWRGYQHLMMWLKIISTDPFSAVATKMASDLVESDLCGQISRYHWQYRRIDIPPHVANSEFHVWTDQREGTTYFFVTDRAVRILDIIRVLDKYLYEKLIAAIFDREEKKLKLLTTHIPVTEAYTRAIQEMDDRDTYRLYHFQGIKDCDTYLLFEDVLPYFEYLSSVKTVTSREELSRVWQSADYVAQQWKKMTGEDMDASTVLLWFENVRDAISRWETTRRQERVTSEQFSSETKPPLCTQYKERLEKILAGKDWGEFIIESLNDELVIVHVYKCGKEIGSDILAPPVGEELDKGMREIFMDVEEAYKASNAVLLDRIHVAVTLCITRIVYGFSQRSTHESVTAMPEISRNLLSAA